MNFEILFKNWRVLRVIDSTNNGVMLQCSRNMEISFKQSESKIAG